jgi:dipeptidyl aminopeptidase/acylaminoacyl peptidase
VYDGEKREWTATDLNAGTSASLSKDIPTAIYDDEDDHPDTAPPHGLGGWLQGETGVVVYDKYDAWIVDPKGATKPVNITSGRFKDTKYRIQDLDPEDRYIDPYSIYFNTQNLYNKHGGFAKRVNGKLSTIVEAPKRFAIASKAKNADVVIISRQDFREYPDLWATNLELKGLKKLTDANPQIKDYNWGTAELVTWTSLDGQPLQGILYKPENFNPGKKYPMIAYFYEKLSDDLFAHRSPAPSASTINIPLFVSNEYLVFVPDIPYKVGYPGESAISAIVPGVQSIVNRGYVNPKKLGIQGQSWGGYQVAYMITETNMFAAAEAGAPVSNMFSAYGGIRYGSGLVRQFQYERQQSRIGGTPWNSTLRYIENSPLFHADKVQTPLMIMHNDKDGAVPYTQGIEYFTALRRLNKPVWMVVYNDEDHNLIQRKNRKDLSVRLSQFFDHFLKDAPMPEWMAKGVPATEKGRNMGLKLMPPK